MTPRGLLRLPLRAARGAWRETRRTLDEQREALEQARHDRARIHGLGKRLRRGPVVVSGFHNEALGIGRAGRLTAQALRLAGFEVLTHDVRPAISGGGRGDFAIPGRGGVWLMHCNAPEARLVLERVRREDLTGRYRIGYWAWELPKAPQDWLETARLFDEIWTPSHFTTDSLQACGVPVRTMPHPTFDLEPSSDGGRFGMAQGVVNFLAMADMRSSAARKNPLGAIEAFRRAYPSAQPKAALTVKIVRPDVDPAGMQALADAAGGRADIRFLTEELDAADVLGLIAAADVLVSLHRAEGFGLTLSEALGLGRAALATGWSGNMQFMADLPDALVPFRLVPVRDGAGVYQGQVWADPDLDAAAAAIRRLTNDPVLRAAIGVAGRQAVLDLNRSWSREALAGQPISRWSPAGRGP